MNHWTGYISSRYLFTHNGRKGHLGNTLAVLGLCVGIMTLITVLTVMNGFQQSFITSINEVYSYHIRISGTEDPLEPAKLNEITRIPGVRALVGFSDRQGILTGSGGLSSGAQLRSIDIDSAESDSSFMKQLTITSGTLPASDSEIILGTSLARYLGVVRGDTISFSYLDPGRGSFRNIDLLVSGIFRTGYYEYDRNMGFSALGAGDAPGMVYGLKLDNHFRDGRVLSVLHRTLPEARVVSWREYNSAFFNALKIEKVFMFLIVALIFIVVAVNIYHSMKRNVKERILELALLKAVGGTALDLRRIYMKQGGMISLVSMTAGTAAGIILSLNVNQIISFFISLQGFIATQISRLPFVSLPVPGQFFFTNIPIEFFVRDILLINISAFVSVMLAAYWSVNRASKVLPAEIFRNE